jgi:hypothetical protein
MEQMQFDSLDNIRKVIGEKLVELRIKKGYGSHFNFACDHDLPPTQYWRIEKGLANMTLKSLDKILTIHGISIDEFFTTVLKQDKKDYQQ